MYSFITFQSIIPDTRLTSFDEFVASGRKKTIEAYVIELLKQEPQGLSNRQISEISSIEIGSLTNPILSLYRSGKIIRSGRRKNVTGRSAIVYSIPFKSEV